MNGIDREDVRDYFFSYFNGAQTYSKKILCNTLLEIIPLLLDYEEESRKIKFDLAICFGEEEIIEPRWSPDNRYPIFYVSFVAEGSTGEPVDDKKERKGVRRCFEAFKTVAKLCGSLANMYMRILSDQRIEIGVYFVNIEESGLTESQMIEDDFILISHWNERVISINGKNGRKHVKIGFTSKYDKIPPEKSNGTESSMVRLWTGIFRRVKREVHGTICMIVYDGWKPGDDMTGIVLKSGIQIPLIVGNDSGRNKLDRATDILINMMNADGITVIDTNGKILAYSMICDIRQELETYGGARHRAYAYLIKNAKNCRAIYFQSEEGETRFYDIDKNPDNAESIFFDASVMGSGKPDGIEEITNDTESFQFMHPDGNADAKISLYSRAAELMDAHNGFDNYYIEPGKAKSLLDFMKGDEYKDALMDFDLTRSKVVNAVFICHIGNRYGVSNKAMPYIDEIIGLIRGDIYQKYFDKEEFYESNILWELSEDRPFKRWEDLLERLANLGVQISEDIKGFDQGHFLKKYYELAEREVDWLGLYDGYVDTDSVETSTVQEYDDMDDQLFDESQPQEHEGFYDQPDWDDLF